MIKGLSIAMDSRFDDIANFLLYVNTWKTDLYLTGSRYFCNHTEKSDWDFFCYGNTYFTDMLVRNSFYPLTKENDIFQSSYSDTGMIVYQLILGDNSIVQIQVYSTIEEVNTKINAQEFLSLKSNIRKIEDKQERKRMWTLTLQMLDTFYGKKAFKRELSM